MTRRQGRRSSAATRRQQRESRSAVFKFGAVALAVVGTAVVYFAVAASHRSLDELTLCPSEPQSVTVLLVDLTDPLNVAQRQDFSNQLIKLKNSVPRYGKLIVAKVDASDQSLLIPVITRCNPGTAQDVSEATGNPGEVQKQWNEGFDKPLQDAFDQLSRASGAESSPILESIQSTALTELQKPGQERIPKRLIVASDLLQNTSEISFYRALPDPNSFVETSAFRRVRTDLRGVEVELWMLERSDAASTQPRALADLWEHLIRTEGGSVSRIYNVSG